MKAAGWVAIAAAVAGGLYYAWRVMRADSAVTPDGEALSNVTASDGGVTGTTADGTRTMYQGATIENGRVVQTPISIAIHKPTKNERAKVRYNHRSKTFSYR